MGWRTPSNAQGICAVAALGRCGAQGPHWPINDSVQQEGRGAAPLRAAPPGSERVSIAFIRLFYFQKLSSQVLGLVLE